MNPYFSMKEFLYGALLGTGSDIEPNSLGIYTLNDNNWKKFFQYQGDTPTVVKFYTTRCSHCQELQPIYEELGRC